MAVEVPRVILLIFLLLFLIYSPDYRTSSPSQQRELSDQGFLERHELSVLNNASYGELDATRGQWLNLTGLREDDNFAWSWLPRVQERAQEQSQTIYKAFALYEKPLTGSAAFNKTSSVAESPIISDVSSHFYHNSSGIVRGQWSQSKIGQAADVGPLNLTKLAPGHEYVSHDYKRNISGDNGELRILFEETDTDEIPSDLGLIRAMKAEMLIKDETSSADGWQVVMFGVHYPQEGRMVFSTTSEKFAGIFALPHFTHSQRSYLQAQELLNQTLAKAIDKQQSSRDSTLNPWTSSPSSASDALFPMARCEFITYLQQHPVSADGINMQEIERELRFPTGVNTQSTPPMKFSALMFSPDCGFVLESKGPPDYPPQEGSHLEGPKIELYVTMAKRAVLLSAMTACAQIFLLKRQMQDTFTPSTRSRVSLYTIIIMATGDGFAFIACLAFGVLIDSLMLPLFATGFAFFICVSFFGMKFIMNVWTVQAPERQEREREQQRRRDERNAEAAAIRSTGPQLSTPAPSNAPVITPAGADTLPLPATARRTPNNIPTQVILPPDQDLDAAAAEDANLTDGATAAPTALTSARRELGALYTKFYFLLLGILFLSVHATSWPAPLRTTYYNTLAFTYLSVWLPQIYRNIIRNCRKALRWEFVVGQSILRLLPLTYFYLYTHNVLFIRTSPPTFYVLAAWVWLQVWVLIAQEILGPRFFVKEGWAPPAYEYHPLLRENSDNEAGSLLPIGFSDAIRSPETDPVSPTTPLPPSSAAAAAERGGGDSSSAFPAPTRQNTGASTRATKTSRRDKSNHTKKIDSNRRIFDCAICTEDIEVPIMASSNAGGGEGRGEGANAGRRNTSASENVGEAAAMIFERRKYMVTPCRHIFHSGCLEGWMRYRLQCPICRENLPPL